MVKRLLRVLKHLWFDISDARRVLDDAALARLGERVARSESRHGGEIRICVEGGLPPSYVWRGAAARERARMMFAKLRVWDTEANNGVLIYLLLADRAIEIVCDRAVARVVTPQDWDAVLAGLRPALQSGRFEAGLAEAVDTVDALLAAHFAPRPPGTGRNELPDLPHRT
ncbi:MAG: TPM domain-containing protein [Rubrivivax sp.]|nr:TPM domain-containing protein [Rubrivivax sp.]